MRRGLLVLVLLGLPTRAWAEWQIKPFMGFTFGGGTTIVDPEHAVGKRNLVIGAGVATIGDVVGIEADVGHAAGFFQSGAERLVLRSSVTTVTGNVVVALPRRLAEYTLRPYFVGGGGLMRMSVTTSLDAFPFDRKTAAVDFGGGVTGFISDRVGVSWDVRHFRSLGNRNEGFSIGPERLSFWRANMALAIRY